jgi:hypothetical protein
MAVSLATLRTRAKRRADRENSAFITDPEWTDYINEVVGELHDLIVMSYEDYELKSTTVSLVANTDSYTLPADFYKERGVELISGGLAYTLRPFVFRERNRYQMVPGISVDWRLNMRYQILGNKIRFVPMPDGAASVTLWYIPQATMLSGDSDTLSLSVVTGWEAFIVLGAAIKALAKEEQDTSLLMAEKSEIAQRIRSAAQGRAGGEPQRVSDVTTPEQVWLWR